jgi:hypothetical protein
MKVRAGIGREFGLAPAPSIDLISGLPSTAASSPNRAAACESPARTGDALRSRERGRPTMPVVTSECAKGDPAAAQERAAFLGDL